MIAHKAKVVLGIVIAICLAMAIPFSASAPVPDSVIGRVHAYYYKYAVYQNWTANYYVNSEGVLTSGTSSLNLRTSSLISLTPDSGERTRTIAVRAHNSDAYFQIRHLEFYDSDQVHISGYGYQASEVGGSGPLFISYGEIPENAAYFRVTIRGSSTGSTARNNYLPLLIPEVLDSLEYVDTYFWSTPIDLTIDSSGWFYVPYQVYTINALYFDIDFYGNEPINISSVDAVLKFEINRNYGSGGAWESFSLPETTTFIGFNSYYIDETGRHYNSTIPVSDLSDADLGLLNFASDLNPASFSGFTLSFDCSYVSSDIRGRIWNLILGSVEVDVALAVDDVLNDLEQLGQALSVPTPDLDTLLNVGGVLDNQNDANASMIMSTIASDGGLITTMMVISVSLTVLGYILFGKKEA